MTIHSIPNGGTGGSGQYETYMDGEPVRYYIGALMGDGINASPQRHLTADLVFSRHPTAIRAQGLHLGANLGSSLGNSTYGHGLRTRRSPDAATRSDRLDPRRYKQKDSQSLLSRCPVSFCKRYHDNGSN
jgi:hypothetical protein